MICVTYGMLSITLPLRVANGSFYRVIFRHLQQFNIISIVGGNWACLNVSMMLWWKRVDCLSIASLNQQPLLLIAKVSKRQKRAANEGFDAGKKVKGRKRHIITDTMGNLLEAIVHEADIQDRDGAPFVLERLHNKNIPSLLRFTRECGYTGKGSTMPSRLFKIFNRKSSNIKPKDNSLLF